MLFFINSALGVCSGEYIGARSITPPLAGAPAWSVPEQVYWSKIPKCILSAGSPPWSVPRQVRYSRSPELLHLPARHFVASSGEYTRAIYQRSARMGLCKKSS